MSSRRTRPPSSTNQLDDDVEVVSLAPDVWLHRTSAVPTGGSGPMAANGLIVTTGRGAILIDTGWNERHAEVLVTFTERRLGEPVVRAVVTHAHEDRNGGAAALERHGVEVLTADAELHVGRQDVEVFFPGAGHTRDNVVVWLPRPKVLFGGCFVKSAASPDLGNVADADVASWPDAMRRVQSRYPEARVVVPGHGDVGGPDLLAHTLDLLGRVARPIE